MGRIRHLTAPPRGRLRGSSYSTIHDFEQTVGKPTEQPRERPRVVTVTGVGADLIRPLPERAAVRYGLSVELTALANPDNELRRLFLCHPENVLFDSMEVSISGTTERTDNLPWMARAQLVQLRADQYWQISGEVRVKDHGEEVLRVETLVPLDQKESTVELQGGYIERPWALFVECQLNAIILPLQLPTWAENARLHVTVNLLARQGGW